MSFLYSLDLIRLHALYKQTDENFHLPPGKTPEEIALSIQKSIAAASPPEILDTRHLTSALSNLEKISALINLAQLGGSSQECKVINATVVRIKKLCDAAIAKYAPELLKRLENQYASLPRTLALEATATVCKVGDSADTFRSDHLPKIRQIIGKTYPDAKNPLFTDSIEAISSFAKKHLTIEETAPFVVTLQTPSGKTATFNRCTLIAVSGFFKAMLNSPFHESNQSVIALGEISDKTLDLLSLLIRKREKILCNLREDDLFNLLDKATEFAFEPELIDLCINAINVKSSLFQLKRNQNGLTLILKDFEDNVQNKLQILLANHPFLGVLVTGVDVMQISNINQIMVQSLGDLFSFIPSFSFTIPASLENPGELFTEGASPRFNQLTIAWSSPPSLSAVESFFTMLNERASTADPNTLFRLNLKKGKMLSEEALLEIAHLAGPSIRELDLEMSKIKDDTLANLAAACPKLEALNLKSCVRLTDTGLQAIGGHLRTLASLSIANPGRGKLSDSTLRTILQNNTRLEKLDLSWQSDLSGSSVQEIAERTPSLKELYLTNCNKISDPEVNLIAHSCAHLGTVALDFCRQLTKEGLKSLLLAKNIHSISMKGLFVDQIKWKEQLAPVLMTRIDNLSLVISAQGVSSTPRDAALLYPAITLEICKG